MSPTLTLIVAHLTAALFPGSLEHLLSDDFKELYKIC